MWCPDPDCRAHIPVESWTVSEDGSEEWDEDSVAVYFWRVDCPDCRRSISAWHGDEADADSVEQPREGAWCCPLCGWPAQVLAEHVGPQRANVGCLGGCGARATLSRAPLAELLARSTGDPDD